MKCTCRGDRQARSAFSVAELVCVLTIIAIMGVLAMPRLGSVIVGQRLDAAARRIVADLTLARQHALANSASVTVRFKSSTTQYGLLNVPHPDRPKYTYLVDLADEPYGIDNVKVSLGGDGEVVFDGFGVVDAAGFVCVTIGVRSRTVDIDAVTSMAAERTTKTVPPGPIDPDAVDTIPAMLP